jgi:hypothetical protein
LVAEPDALGAPVVVNVDFEESAVVFDSVSGSAVADDVPVTCVVPVVLVLEDMSAGVVLVARFEETLVNPMPVEMGVEVSSVETELEELMSVDTAE